LRAGVSGVNFGDHRETTGRNRSAFRHQPVVAPARVCLELSTNWTGLNYRHSRSIPGSPPTASTMRYRPASIAERSQRPRAQTDFPCIVPDGPIPLGLLWHLRKLAPQLHQFGGAREGQRIEQYALDSGEDHRGRADTQRNRKQGDAGEDGRTPEQTQGEPHVAKHRHVTSFYPALACYMLLDLGMLMFRFRLCPRVCVAAVCVIPALGREEIPAGGRAEIRNIARKTHLLDGLQNRIAGARDPLFPFKVLK